MSVYQHTMFTEDHYSSYLVWPGTVPILRDFKSFNVQQNSGFCNFLIFDASLSSSLFTVYGYGMDSRLEVNLMESLTLTNRMADVIQVPGLHDRSPAFLLQGGNRLLQVPDYTFEKAINLLRSDNEFTLMASIKQDVRNSGSIISMSEGRSNEVTPSNDTQYLELYTSTRREEIKFFYRSDNEVYQERFSYQLKPETWTKIALSVSGTHLALYVDCNKIYERVIHKPDLDVDPKGLAMFLGQRSQQAYFKGILQDVKLVVSSHGYLSQCSELERQCPTCGEYMQMVEDMDRLASLLQVMENRVVTAERRITELEECRCQKSCQYKDMLKEDSDTWTDECQVCNCTGGVVQCGPMTCPTVSCKYPVIPNGQCCPVCREQCFFIGKYLDDGEEISPRECYTCKCTNGNVGCVSHDRNEICPKLTCPTDEQFTVSGECCKFCRGVDYCTDGHDCHPNATCVSLETSHTCQCNAGFQGDGKECVDVNECENEGGPIGHHCRDSTECVNVPGSYYCQCLPGYRRIDAYTCIELDECAFAVHDCDINAQCINTDGSYKCVCPSGYYGDGFKCEAKCTSTCLNGGRCVAPDSCQCPSGYLGDHCQTDIDECASGTHGCHSNSECINLPGSFYCQCKTGYHSDEDPHSDLGASCEDIDECDDNGMCHRDMTCLNEDGGYQCQCNNIDQCHGKCIHDGEEIRNGQQFKPDDECYTCQCQDGVKTCTPDVCDCNAATVNLDCCPHCDFNGQCLHQLKPVVYDDGDRWDYECQRCQCLNGRIDCNDKSCPELNCGETVTPVGACCPICLDDVCSLDITDDIIRNPDDVLINCEQDGVEYFEGDRWVLSEDNCSDCVCRRGKVCCTFKPEC
ncbi:protein kinase C-binding protein NELL1-like [Glandiceps talaboti]